MLARAVAAQLGADFGQTFIVENRPGANATIASNVVVQSAPDGYTLLFTSDSIAPTPFIYKSLPYDVFKDLAPVATVGVLDGLLMLVNPSSPAHNVKEFIDYAKKNPVFYGSPGIGNGLHLAAALFNKATGLHMEHVPFKGASEVSAALLGGDINVMFVTPPSVIGLIKSGQLRALAFTGSKPFSELPDVPLMKDTVPDYPPIKGWGIFFAPAKTPPALIDKLNAADAARAHGAGRRQCGAEIRLYSRQPFAGADGGVFSPASRGRRQSGRGRRHRAELIPSFRRRAVGGQDFAGEIKRAGDQDARRRLEIELAGDREGAFDIVARQRRNADAAGNFGKLRRRHRLVLMDRHRR